MMVSTYLSHHIVLSKETALLEQQRETPQLFISPSYFLITQEIPPGILNRLQGRGE